MSSMFIVNYGLLAKNSEKSSKTCNYYRQIYGEQLYNPKYASFIAKHYLTTPGFYATHKVELYKLLQPNILNIIVNHEFNRVKEVMMTYIMGRNKLTTDSCMRYIANIVGCNKVLDGE